MIKCVALDIGGILHRRLASTDLAGKKAQLSFLKKNGYVCSLVELVSAVDQASKSLHERKRSRKPLSYSHHILRLLGITENDVFAQSFTHAYYAARLKADGKQSLAPGVRSFLRVAEKNGILLGVITDNDSSWSKEWIKGLKLPISQDLILVSNEIGGGKSSVKPFRLFLKKARTHIKGLPPHEILMVGNHSRDLNAGKIGFKTCYYNAQKKSLSSKDLVPDYTITHFLELKKILDIP